MFAHAQSGTSANYALTATSFDAGGTPVSSTNYAINPSVSAAAGSQSSSNYANSNGFPGQIYNAVGLSLAAPASSVDEGIDFQLSAAEQMDDGTYLAENPSSVNWGILSGPLISVSGSGVATAGTATQNTGASITGTYGGFTGTLNLTVVPLVIATGSSEQSAVVGQPFSFTISPAGSEGPFTYQWMQSGTTIPGATNPTLTIASAAPSNAGNYTVQVTDSLGSYTTTAFDLMVNSGVPAISCLGLAALALLIFLITVPRLRVKQLKS